MRPKLFHDTSVMMKPEMTKKRSTPAAPALLHAMVVLVQEFSCIPAWQITTEVAPIARRTCSESRCIKPLLQPPYGVILPKATTYLPRIGCRPSQRRYAAEFRDRRAA